jgi:phenylalanyl-tRNA synthetase alpha chain
MLDKMINELHIYEKKLLKELSENEDLTPEEIAEKENMPVKAVTSAAGMLSSKDIIKVDKTSKDINSLSQEGKDYAINGLPEHRILKSLQKFTEEGKDEVTLEEIIEDSGVTKQQMNFSIGVLMRNRWVRMNNGKLSLTDDGKNANVNDLPQVKFLN